MLCYMQFLSEIPVAFSFSEFINPGVKYTTMVAPQACWARHRNFSKMASMPSLEMCSLLHRLSSALPLKEEESGDRLGNVRVTRHGLCTYISTTLPGFIMLSGSRLRLSVRISSTPASPNSGTRYSFFPSPIPCSPVHVPSIAMARYT